MANKLWGLSAIFWVLLVVLILVLGPYFIYFMIGMYAGCLGNKHRATKLLELGYKTVAKGIEAELEGDAIAKLELVNYWSSQKEN